MDDESTKPILISIVGPTGIGKTSMAIRLAKTFGSEIISADSRQFYKELTIGTAKPSETELSAAKHHFINSHTIKELYSAGEFGRDAKNLLNQLFEKKKHVIAVGGSSLYLRALWEGFDNIPEIDPAIRSQLNLELQKNGIETLLEELEEVDEDYYHQVDKKNGQRVVRALEVIRGTGSKFSSFRKSIGQENEYRNLKVGLTMDREELFDRINRRMDEMIEQGLFEEAQALYSFRDHNALQTVGYSEIFEYMDGAYDKTEAIRLLKRNSRRYAKRQMTWFRKYEDIRWFNPSEYDEIFNWLEPKIDLIDE